MCYVNQVALHPDLFAAIIMPVRIKKKELEEGIFLEVSGITKLIIKIRKTN